jgi:hypothetical protein
MRIAYVIAASCSWLLVNKARTSMARSGFPHYCFDFLLICAFESSSGCAGKDGPNFVHL